MLRYSILFWSALLLTSGTIGERSNKPAVWLIGDSTVKNGSGKGAGGLWGWGDYLYKQFDTTRISIKNYALGGRSSRTFISGATPIVCSLIPRNIWENGKVVRSAEDYEKWAEESALKEKAFYINLNERIAAKYEAIGEEDVKTKFFLTDHTHTTEAGAILNATSVAEGIKSLKGCKLKKYLNNR